MHVSRQLGPFSGGGCGSCARCGINQVPLEPMAVDEMQIWLTLQEEQRRLEPGHEYMLEDYGLTQKAVNEAFEPYRDFANSRGFL